MHLHNDVRHGDVRPGIPFAGSPAGRVLAPLAVAAAAVCTAAYVGAVDPNQPGHYPTCPFLYLTGYYCPGCGSLRAIHAVVHGDLLQAVDRNPLTVAFLPYLVLTWISWLRRGITGAPRRDLAPPWVIWTLLGVVVAFWVLRNLPGFAWLAP
ncbi:MAG TPA: DUF2752 domain-containing protein [Kineosporiaceae bacterium]|nr:DUF2752 domain-containing protein [Kineosporiaceae bacterium]